jgi:hypothetical protein
MLATATIPIGGTLAKLSKTKLSRFIDNSQSMRNDPDYPIFEAGLQEGRRQMQVKALTYLEDKYLSAPDRPDRNSPEAKWLLSMAKELKGHLSD